MEENRAYRSFCSLRLKNTLVRYPFSKLRKHKISYYKTLLLRKNKLLKAFSASSRCDETRLAQQVKRTSGR